MSKPVWVSPNIGHLKVHVFQDNKFPTRGVTPEGDMFSIYEFNPAPQVVDARLLGVYRLDDLCWY